MWGHLGTFKGCSGGTIGVIYGAYERKRMLKMNTIDVPGVSFQGH
jgi:hypothetical protein